MSKKKDNDLTGKKSVKFKPGDKPYCYFGKEILNKNVPWLEIILEILKKGYTLYQLAKLIGVDFKILRQVVQLNYGCLPFRAGARILTLHSQLLPMNYFETD